MDIRVQSPRSFQHRYLRRSPANGWRLEFGYRHIRPVVDLFRGAERHACPRSTPSIDCKKTVVRGDKQVDEPLILKMVQVSIVVEGLNIDDLVDFRFERLRVDADDSVSDFEIFDVLYSFRGYELRVTAEAGVQNDFQTLGNDAVEVPLLLAESRDLRKGLVVADPEVAERTRDEAGDSLPFSADPVSRLGDDVPPALFMGAVHCFV